MNEAEELQFARQLRLRLNRGLHELPAETTARLQAARQLALSRQRVSASSSVLATVGEYVHSRVERVRIDQLLAALALALCIAFTAYWHADQSISDLEEIDSALLADDLPVAALTDKGFDAWLKSSSASQ
ncbi:DUF3619 family protein [Rhodocyclus tenuis]|uniref:DUF3619 family protein n=1 Tax=Rhodocyclus gracilis TaxID=2929842 RepID=A0ABX0WH41_9RHOO|nr:DUF3619 family protein [Rhodocyclus gracilis]MRD73169.1 DUF3619 family protein [Rhodocyclus gracilis]NJA89051.1 DUF3619 family protein [Rhodocyclus gracilis]